MDADKFLSWLSEVEGEIRKEKMKECQPDRYDDGLMAATGTIREYVEKMCKIDEAEGKADQSWIPCSERFPDGDRYEARNLIREQGKQILHEDVAEYIARKLGIKSGGDTVGDETGREQCEEREQPEKRVSERIQSQQKTNQ